MDIICEDVLKAVNGNLLQGDRKQYFTGISTDSRRIKDGELFVALKGPKFNGHNFALEALEKKAGGVMIEEERVHDFKWDVYRKRPVILVKDTLRALGDLARDWRRKYGTAVIAVTGSNGKTTTKEMIAACLESSIPTAKTEGNLNNLIGLPLNLLRLTGKEKVAVIEMGMNVPGEIKRLTEIAEPDIGIITNIEHVHLEGLGDIERVKNEKGELFRGMSKAGTILVNQDDTRVVELAEEFQGSKITFGIEKEADIMAKDIKFKGSHGMEFTLITKDIREDFFIPLLGKHFIPNALCAIGISRLFNIEIEKVKNVLENFRPFQMRMEVFRLGDGITLINDAYNANPKSMAYALETVSMLKKEGRAIAVLGDMLELGEFTEEAHRNIGELIGRLSIDFLLAIGDQSPILIESAIRSGLSPENAKIIESHHEAVLILKGMARPGDFILVKGSRKMAMEEIVKGLLNRGE